MVGWTRKTSVLLSRVSSSSYIFTSKAVSTPNLLSSGQVSRLKLTWEQTEVNKNELISFV